MTLDHKDLEHSYKPTLQHEILGMPKKEVVANVLKAVQRTLDEMGYQGDLLPHIVISDGWIVSDKGVKQISCYDWGSEPKTIRVGQEGLNYYWEQLGVNVEDEITSLICASHEAVHFVQDQEGRLPKKGNIDSITDPDIHYASEYEQEAESVSFRVTNMILGYEFIKRND